MNPVKGLNAVPRSKLAVRRRIAASSVCLLILVGFLQLFTPASAAGGPPGAFAIGSISNESPGATAVYTLNLTTSATGALAAGSGTITI
ncbi:MAG TPA: hypothetical protein VMU77_03260, partial [Acidimicrobiales bacterium]|nr:hypothetical protein [Acidimicrobiales bacterium]